MHPFPHHYLVRASAAPDGDIVIHSDGVSQLATAAPAEFDGPGDRWSPETLLVAAAADCFALTFRGIARISRLPWVSLCCEVEGVLERVDHVSQFTGFIVRARVRVPDGTDVEHARRVIIRAEQTCLVTNSLRGGVQLEAEVETVSGVPQGPPECVSA